MCIRDSPLLVKGTGRDAIGAIGTALVIIGRYASFSIFGGLSLLLLVSASGYAFASTGAYGSLALLDRTQKRIGFIGLASGGGSNEHSTASSRHLSLPCLFFLNLNKGGDGLCLRSVPTVFFSPSRHDPGVQASRSNHRFSSRKLVGWLKCGYAGRTKVKWEVASSNV